MTLRCSCCRRDLPVEWFTPQKRTRGYSYWCRTCKRLADLRRFYKLKITRALDKIEAWEMKLKEIDERIGPGRKKDRCLPTPSLSRLSDAIPR